MFVKRIVLKYALAGVFGLFVSDLYSMKVQRVRVRSSFP